MTIISHQLDTMYRVLRRRVGPADLRQLLKFERWGRVASLVGWTTALFVFNPISVLALAFAKGVDFTIGHHVSHGAYDGCIGVPPRLTSEHYAVGWRRMVDWFTWWRPAASWAPCHNIGHHLNTQEETDVDAIDTKTLALLPRFMRYVVIALSAVTWQFLIYPRIFTRARVLYGARKRRRRSPSTMGNMRVGTRDVCETLLKDLLPYLLLRFVVPPLLCLPIGGKVAATVFWNLLAAELLHNFHVFVCTRPSHIGPEIPTFVGPVRNKDGFYVRQILGSVNFATGQGDIWDLLQLFSNYQIEHHVMMRMPMLALQRAQPQVKAIAGACDVPYVQDSILRRFSCFVTKSVDAGTHGCERRRTTTLSRSPFPRHHED